MGRKSFLNTNDKIKKHGFSFLTESQGGVDFTKGTRAPTLNSQRIQPTAKETEQNEEKKKIPVIKGPSL